jgi:hypothetical protein
MTGRRRVARVVLVVGAGLAVAAGLVQATIGDRIPSWTGNKADPGPLGLLTVALGAVAVGAAVLLTATARGAVRAGAVAAITLVAVIGATTVGRLWYAPGLLLVVGLVVRTEDWRAVIAALRREWSRVLLVVLGGCELLMVVRSRPLVMVFGVVAGAALMAAAVPGPRRRTIALVVLAPLPFLVLAWTALVPLVVSVMAVLVALGIHEAAVPPRPKVEPM